MNEEEGSLPSPICTIRTTHSSLQFEDADSDIDSIHNNKVVRNDNCQEKDVVITPASMPDSFTVGLDSILASVETANLTPSELESSKRIRKKYGLNEDNLSIVSTNVYEAQIDIILNTMQLIVHQFMEELVKGGVVENEHPLLEPFVALIEIALWHGWNNPRFFGGSTMWDLIQTVERRGIPSRTAIENVRQFTTLKTTASKIRAWIRLTLMNKCLSPDLYYLISHDSARLSEYYDDWACVRSDSFQAILGSVSTLDAIDFNLFVREEDISKPDFNDNWRKIFRSERINFEALTPPIRVSLDLLRTVSSIDLHPKVPKNSEEGSLIERLVVLNDENARLRKSLVAQINQRAYFQDEYSKSQSRCASFSAEQHSLQEENVQLKRQIKDLMALVETHEATNEALQKQLADAYGADDDRDQVARLRNTINSLSADLETERTTHKATKDALTDICEEKSILAEQYEATIKQLEIRLTEGEEMATDRIKVLSEQLKLANNLKEEYKKRLKESDLK